jgi:glyoxylase-like metal-dependent hydrolase (beta-lactamase superfamily II)
VARASWHQVPVPAFILEHPGAGLLLVDTGLHAVTAVDPGSNLGRIVARFLPVEMRPEWAVPARLHALGFAPADVAVVVMTHLHTDHASGVAAFPDATFVTDEGEWAAAATGGLVAGYRPAMIDYPFDWRTLDFEAVGAESYDAFARTIDLFGDGSVRVISTPGHSPGHCSVLLRLTGDGELLLTADAAYSEATIRDGLVSVFRYDERLYRRSLGEIQRYLEHNRGTVVICGHDPVQWPRLATVYQ